MWCNKYKIRLRAQFQTSVMTSAPKHAFAAASSSKSRDPFSMNHGGAPKEKCP